MSLEFTLVRRSISLAVIDGPDTGDNPDILQAQGSVLFEPVIKKGDSIQVETRGGSETYALAPIECPINDGIISHRGQDGVKLPAGGEAANPSLIRWKATFSRMQAGGKSFTLAPVIFDAVPGGEIDLTMVAPVAGAPEGVVRGPRGTSLESIIVDGSELVFTAVDDAGSFEIARIPLDEMVRAEAEAAADGVRDALAVDVAASQSARDAAEGHANRAATSESNAAASESAAKQSEGNAGDFAAVATTAATEAVGAMERATEIAGGDFATQSALSNAVENALRVDTTLTTWTADAVGGRNLLQGSSAEPTKINFTASMYYRDITGDTRLEVGQEYTLSVIVDKLSDDDHPISIQVGTGTGKNYTRDITQPSRITPGERTVITFTPTEYHLDGRTHFAWRIRNEKNETRVAYREAKLERGPVATPWTPSPEDSVQSLFEDNPLSSLLSPFPAPDSALALRVDSSVGTRVFVGDTMIYGDTGWRDVTSLVRSGWTASTFLMRRVGELVEVRANALDGTNATDYFFFTPPEGFLPGAGSLRIAASSNDFSISAERVNIATTGAFSQVWRTNTTHTSVALSANYLTDDSWPTTLPGTPA